MTSCAAIAAIEDADKRSRVKQAFERHVASAAANASAATDHKDRTARVSAVTVASSTPTHVSGGVHAAVTALPLGGAY